MCVWESVGVGKGSIFWIMNNVGIGDLNLTKLSPKLSQLDFQLFFSFSITSFSCLFRGGHLQFFFLQLPCNCITLFHSFSDFKFSGCLFAFVVIFFWHVLFWTGNSHFTTIVFYQPSFCLGVICELSFIAAIFLAYLFYWFANPSMFDLSSFLYIPLYR